MKRCENHTGNIEVIYDDKTMGNKCPLCAAYEDAKFYLGCITTYENLINATLLICSSSSSSNFNLAKYNSFRKLKEFMQDYLAGRLTQKQIDEYMWLGV
jgi:hypothetical protein